MKMQTEGTASAFLDGKSFAKKAFTRGKKAMTNKFKNSSAVSVLAVLAAFSALGALNIGCATTSPKVVQMSEDGKTFTLQLSRDSRSLMAGKPNKDALDARTELQKRKELSTTLLNSIAELSLLGGVPDQAAREARLLLKADLKNTGAMKTLIKVSLAQARFEEAVLLANNAIGTSPREADFYCLRGLANYFLDHPLDAREDWKKALTIDPTNIPAQMNLAALYFQNRNIALAGTGFERVIALQPQNLDAQVGRALVTSASGNPEEARRSLHTVLTESPKNPLVLANLAMIERDRFSNYQAALDYTERYLEVAGADRIGVERAVAGREELRQLVAKKAEKLSDAQLRQLASKSAQRMQGADEEKPENRNTAMVSDSASAPNNTGSKKQKDAAAAASAKPSAAQKSTARPAVKDLGAEDASSLEEAIK